MTPVSSVDADQARSSRAGPATSGAASTGAVGGVVSVEPCEITSMALTSGSSTLCRKVMVTALSFTVAV